jgi:hypothetical protein
VSKRGLAQRAVVFAILLNMLCIDLALVAMDSFSMSLQVELGSEREITMLTLMLL